MALKEKYKELIETATASGVSDLLVKEKEGALYIEGRAPDGKVKNQLWKIYDKIDPNYITGDLVLNVNVDASATGGKAKVTISRTALNIRRGPAMAMEVIGWAQQHDVVTVMSQTNPGWWLIRTDNGTEGYVASQYLTMD